MKAQINQFTRKKNSSVNWSNYCKFFKFFGSQFHEILQDSFSDCGLQVMKSKRKNFCTTKLCQETKFASDQSLTQSIYDSGNCHRQIEIYLLCIFFIIIFRGNNDFFLSYINGMEFSFSNKMRNSMRILLNLCIRFRIDANQQ